MEYRDKKELLEKLRSLKMHIEVNGTSFTSIFTNEEVDYLITKVKEAVEWDELTKCLEENNRC